MPLWQASEKLDLKTEQKLYIITIKMTRAWKLIKQIWKNIIIPVNNRTPGLLLRTFTLISVCTHSTLNELLFCSVNIPFLSSRCVYKGSHMELLEFQGMQSHSFLVWVLVATKPKLQIILVALVGLLLLVQGVEAWGKVQRLCCVQFGLCKLSACWWRQEQGCLGSACKILLNNHLNSLGLGTPPIIWY